MKDDIPYKTIRIFEHLPNSEMVFIEGGTFQMGDEVGDLWEACRPVHTVHLSDFYIGAYPVTQALWKAVMGEANNPSYFQGDHRPVERVSWEDVCGNKEKDITGFLEKLNAIPEITQQNQLDGRQFRLPTEAQWEYAARGGKEGLSYPYPYAGSNQLKEVCWYDLNSHGETKPVGLKAPNYLGFYDMSGNVWEWCADVWHENYEGAPKDGSTWMDGSEQKNRVVRGGSWYDFNVDFCRVAYRSRNSTDDQYDSLGFRLVRY